MRNLGAAVSTAIALAGCGQSPKAEPAGYVLVEVDTDLPVPQLLDRVRIDVFSDDGVWLGSRDYPIAVPTVDPPEDSHDAGSSEGVEQRLVSGSQSFPLSFALEPEQGRTESLVRVRGYRGTKIRDYLGERYQPPVEAVPVISRGRCEALPELSLESPVELAVAGSRIGEPAPTCEGESPASSVRAAAFNIAEPGNYQLSIDRVTPDSAWPEFSRPVLFIVKECDEQAPVIACGAIGAGSGGTGASTLGPAGVTAKLARGDYVVLLANQVAANLEARLVLRAVDTEPAPIEPTPPDPSDPEPRLLVGDLDVTPDKEPEPDLAVDRLARVVVSPVVDSSIRLMLFGDCLGTMADFERRESCVGPGGGLVELQPELVSKSTARSTHSVAGTWIGAEKGGCEDDVEDQDARARVCMAGGAFTLGDSTVVASGADATTPERVVQVSPFYLDREEFSVRRYRELVRSGAAPDDLEPVNDPNPFDFETGATDRRYCTYNAEQDGSAIFPEREDLPLTCVSWVAARAICQAAGGDLPTSAQWEHAAAATGGSEETLYPWGDDSPDCDRAVYARWPELSTGVADCAAEGFGPIDVAASLEDVTKFGVIALGGNVSEWTLDSHRAYSEPCWAALDMSDPSCQSEGAPLRTVKGSSWRRPGGDARSSARFGAPPGAVDDSIGFRCVYPSSGVASP